MRDGRFRGTVEHFHKRTFFSMNEKALKKDTSVTIVHIFVRENDFDYGNVSPYLIPLLSFPRSTGWIIMNTKLTCITTMRIWLYTYQKAF